MSYPTYEIPRNSSSAKKSGKWRVIYRTDECGGITFTDHPTLRWAQAAKSGHPKAVIHRTALV